MEFREPRTADTDRFATVAEQSMRAAYGDAIEEETIDDLVQRWYNADHITQLLEEEATIWRVADVDGDIAAFVQAGVLNTDPIVGEIDWIHVLPEVRGEGLARQLIGAIQDTVENRGANRLRGYVLAGNDNARSLYEETGFEQVGEREARIGDNQHREYVYEKSLDESADEAVVETVSGPDGEFYVDYSQGDGGTAAPMYAAFQTEDLAEQWGWYCSNCDSLTANMGPMGRIQCEECENMREATRWDSGRL